MSQKTQSFKNHAKFVPLFHFFAFPLAALTAVWWTTRAVKHPSGDAVVMALMGWSLVATTFLARIFALTVQDRKAIKLLIQEWEADHLRA